MLEISPYDIRRIYTFYHEAKEILVGRMPKPRMALIYPSRICNQDCYYCSDGRDNKRINRFMDTEQFLKLPKRLKNLGCESVELCGGGEPFLHPEIKKFIKECSKQSLRLASLTNGTMLKGELLELVIEHFSYVRVSLDTFDPQLYERIRRLKSKEAALPAVLANLREAVRMRNEKKRPIMLGAKMCLDEKNITEMGEAIARAQEIGIDSIQIKLMRNAGVEEKIEPEELEKYEKELQDYKKRYKDIVILGSLKKFTIDHLCWLSPFHVFIDTEGSVRLCCYYQFRAERHTYGNAFENSLEEIWYGKRHFEALKNIQVEECNKWDCKYFMYNKLMKKALIENRAQWQFV